MISKKKKIDARADFSNHVLFALELQIARRADELAGTATLIPDQDFEIWLRAEQEVMSRLGGGRRRKAKTTRPGAEDFSLIDPAGDDRGRRAIQVV
jgi:hypothetical protein